jgi:hypothetical protein
MSNDVVVIAGTAARLASVEIVARDPILFGVGTRRALAVLGHYDDGFARELTAALGTRYGTSSPAVATVGDDGVLLAAGAGITTVTAENSGVQDSITVTVNANAEPVAHAGPDVVRTCVTPGAKVAVQLDGSASFDPEGDSLVFGWFEGTSRVASERAPLVEFGSGTHAIDLVVTDAANQADQDTVQVSIVEDTTPPSVSIRTIAPLVPLDLHYRTLSLADCAQASDACGGTENVNLRGQIVAIHSDEPDGHHPLDPRDDIVILDRSHFKLRRQAQLLGNGRVYEIELTVEDAHHNTSSVRSCFVGVRTLGQHGSPVNDGRIFTVLP